MRSQRKYRGIQTLTVIDPDTRLRNGLPILDIAAEINHYNIPDPYRKSIEYYNGYYLCLWQVTEKEVVGHWQWNDLVTHKTGIKPSFCPLQEQNGAIGTAERVV